MLQHSRILNAFLILAAVTAAVLVGCEPEKKSDTRPYVQAASQNEAGRYLTFLSGCHDCHTPGWIQTDGQVPESEWFAGNPLGWRGPWGTTYPPNLRLTVRNMTEDVWVQMFRTRTARPPHPWMNFREASDSDLRAMYSYIRSLGPTEGTPPAYLPPGQEPQPPYFDLVAPPGE